MKAIDCISPFTEFHSLLSFRKYGKIDDLWLASYPPFYAFITFKSTSDAEKAIKKMNDA